MFHLPKLGARLWAWPDPKRDVADQPSAEGMLHLVMSETGRLVTWDSFRYQQYLSGDLHFFDPRTSDQKRIKPSPDDAEKALYKYEISEELRETLKDLALDSGDPKCHLYTEAKSDAEAAAKASEPKLTPLALFKDQ